MAAGDIRQQLRASSALTVTALNGAIASSTTFVAGWTSGTIDNSTNLDLDLWISGNFTAESAGLTAGQIRVYLYTEDEDNSWPDLFSAGTEGTEGTATVHDTEVLDSGMYLLWSTVTDTSASRVYTMPQTSVQARIGFTPRKCALFVAHSMVAALETSGNAIYVKGASANVAQS